MMPEFNFTKMHALGNDFVVIDQTQQDYQLSADRIRQLSDRHKGIGFDQLLLVEKSNEEKSDFFYRVFNADASEVNQCGNGVRCFARFVYEKGLTDKKQITVSTRTGLMHTIILVDNTVQVNMGLPNFNAQSIPFLTQNEQLIQHSSGFEFGLTNMGNPHCTLLVDDIETTDVEAIGQTLMADKNFPQQVNVGFMQVINAQEIILRVYERGVGQTQACGSGACAGVTYGVRLGLLKGKVIVHLLGGKLSIEYELGQPVMMSGEAVFVFDGSI